MNQTAVFPKTSHTTIGVCPSCDGEKSRLKYRLPSHDIHKCVTCGFIFNASFEGGGDDDGMFNKEYFLEHHNQAFASHAEDYTNDPSLPVFEKRLTEIEEMIPKGRLLDIGPGLGTFLRLSKERGWQPRGLDISQFGAAHIERVHDVPMTVGNLCESDLEKGSFDLITFWDSIEHVAFPRQDLTRAFELLRPGGVVLMTTDNFDCLVANIAAAMYRMSFGKITYPVGRVFIDKNFAYFTEASLRDMVTEIGFVDLKVEKMEYPIDKIRLSLLEKCALSVMYGLAAVTGRQAQITLIAKKP